MNQHETDKAIRELITAVRHHGALIITMTKLLDAMFYNLPPEEQKKVTDSLEAGLLEQLLKSSGQFKRSPDLNQN